MKSEDKMISCIYTSPREACKCTRRDYESVAGGRKLHILPYNRFKPDESNIWWLSPSPDNPAYKYGKFAFLAGDNGTMQVGLYVEKGLGSEYCAVANTKSARFMILDRDWAWHNVVRDMAGGKICAALDVVSKRSECAVEVHVEGGYATPGFEPEKPRYQWDRFAFQLTGTKGDLIPVEIGHEGNVLGRMEDCGTLTKLASELSRFTPNGFVWIDLLFSLRLKMGTNGEHSWNSEQIAWNVLSPLEAWVK